MKHTDLIRTGRQTVDDELSDRIGDERLLRALDDNVRAGEVPAIEAVDDDARDGGSSPRCGRLRRWRCLLLREQRRTGSRSSDHGSERKAYREMHHSSSAGSYADSVCGAT